MPEFKQIIQEIEKRVSPLEPLTSKELDRYGVQLFVKRDDLIDTYLSGNKWRKLHLNILEAIRTNQSTLLTFGGAYSNHIYAVAAAGQRFGLKTIGLIRGEAPKKFGPTLRFAEAAGMELHFLSRSTYRAKEIPSGIDTNLCYLLPEGGTNCLGIKGCRRIVEEIKTQLPDQTIDYYCTSSGTGGTATGIISALAGESEALVFSALKGDFLKKDIQQLLSDCSNESYGNWQLISDYHFGGYAKFKPELIEFMNQFHSETGIPLDPVYTGKMFYGIFNLLKQGFFKKGNTIVAVHTGGMQGVAGFNERYSDLLRS